MSKPEQYIVRTSQVPTERMFHFSHPLNPDSGDAATGRCRTVPA